MRRRALLIGVPGGGISVSLAAERLGPLLEDLGFSVARCVGSRATRRAVLAALDRFVRQTRPDDACFVHYFGHGGRIRFEGLEQPYTDTIFGYVTTVRDEPGELAAVLDVELSARFTALDELCTNVTVMLDCCYSAELVRGPTDKPLSNFHIAPAPEHVRGLLAGPTPRLALDSHPRIIRLCGASAQREAFAEERRGRHIGHMTDSFINILDGRDRSEVAQICWGALVHELRERVIDRVGFEGQWVALAGPRNRHLFEPRASGMPATITFNVPRPKPDEKVERPLTARQGWIRAGWHQGVSVGDRWAVLGLELDDEGAPQVIGQGSVRELDPNRALVELDTLVEAPLPLGSPALPLGLAKPMPVAGDEPELARSGWLKFVDRPDAIAAVHRSDDALVVESLAGERGQLELGSVDEARVLLEQQARVWALRRALAAHESAPCPLAWTCHRASDGATLSSGSELRAGERIWLELHHTKKSPPYNWFASVLLVEADGRPRLLNARMPEGIELTPLGREQLGLRPGQAARGFELAWPAGLGGDQASVRVVVLASRRPVALAHIAREQALDEDAALALQGLLDPHRAHEPAPSKACAWFELPLTLHKT